ncbi:hypothetical protein [Hymenobacter lucidus]|uniref:Uncharacterized protein n=1 Tax=Hymenobacter lucidus TaxID=2880930 RepID=A0ABS8AXL5_9BACT|nr:hypothetical protein [Hymenobacter lucidus]MCB2410561.1 hypothetical protein [Hymenobacter lucidus]
MLEFLAEMVGEALVNALLGMLGWLVKMIFYGPLLALGLVCLWWAGRLQAGFKQVWQRHPLAVIHQAGWQATVLFMQYATAVVLVLPLLALAVWLFTRYAL